MWLTLKLLLPCCQKTHIRSYQCPWNLNYVRLNKKLTDNSTALPLHGKAELNLYIYQMTYNNETTEDIVLTEGKPMFNWRGHVLLMKGCIDPVLYTKSIEATIIVREQGRKIVTGKKEKMLWLCTAYLLSVFLAFVWIFMLSALCRTHVSDLPMNNISVNIVIIMCVLI